MRSGEVADVFYVVAHGAFKQLAPDGAEERILSLKRVDARLCAAESHGTRV